FVAGTSGVPYWKFITFDGIAACVSAPAWIYLGWWARQHRMLNRVWRWSSRAQMGTLAILAGVVLLWFVVSRLRRRARRKAGLPSGPPGAVTPTPLRAVQRPK